MRILTAAEVELTNKGQNVVWLMDGTSVASASLTNTVANLDDKVVGIGDADADGKSDAFGR